MNPQARQIISEASEAWKTDKIISSPDGLLILVNGAPFPMKTVPMPDAIWAINICKKQLIGTVRILGSWQLLPSLIFLPFWKSFIRKWLDSITRIGHGVLAPYVDYVHLKGGPYPLSPASRELRTFTELFLNELGLGGKMEWKVLDRVEHTRSWFFATILSHICEFDSAYRWRLQDLASSSSLLALLNSSAQELWRLSNLAKDREVHPNTGLKTQMVLRLLALSTLIPQVRRALRKTLIKINFHALCLDEPDLYWFSLRDDYNCQGRSFDERMAMMAIRGWGIPPTEKVGV